MNTINFRIPTAFTRVLLVHTTPTKAGSSQSFNFNFKVFSRYLSDHYPLSSGPSAKVFPNGTLLIEAVSKERDRGTYSCTARNSKGQRAEGATAVAVIGKTFDHEWVITLIRFMMLFDADMSSSRTYCETNQSISISLNLDIPVAPSIHPFTVPSGLQRGHRLSLTCSVFKGNTPLKISWARNDTSQQSQSPSLPAPDLSPVQIDDFTSMLTISDLDLAHNGAYTCLAENAAGSASHTVHLRVNGNLTNCALCSFQFPPKSSPSPRPARSRRASVLGSSAGWPGLTPRSPSGG